jgi:hypothetical protein
LPAAYPINCGLITTLLHLESLKAFFLALGLQGRVADSAMIRVITAAAAGQFAGVAMVAALCRVIATIGGVSISSTRSQSWLTMPTARSLRSGVG